MRARLVLPLLVLACLAAAPSAGAIMKNNDSQLWTSTQLMATLVPQLTLRSEINFRFGEGMSEFYQYHAELGLTYLVVKDERFRVDLSVLYRQRYKLEYHFDAPSTSAREVRGWWAEYRPWAMLTAQVRLGRFVLGDTVKLEPRFYDNYADELRFRNNVFAAYDVPASPTYAFQMFLDVHINVTCYPDPEYFRTRIYAGFMFPIAGPLGVNVYYMWQRFRTHPGWWSWHVLGTTLTFKFRRSTMPA